MAITGPGAAALAVSGGNTVEVFSVAAAVTNATISGLTIENGTAAGGANGANGTGASGGNGGVGGGIYNAGTLSLSNDTLSNNTGGSGGKGGGGVPAPNSATNGGDGGNAGNGGDGGAIYNAGTGTLTITNSTLSGNMSGGGYNDGGIGTPAGGGMGTTDGGKGGNGGNAGNGGAIYNAGVLTVSNSLLTSNTAGLLASIYGIAGFGGAASTSSQSGVNGDGGDGGKGGNGGSGGGVYNAATGTLTVSTSTISGNAAGSGYSGGTGGHGETGTVDAGSRAGSGGPGGMGGSGGGIYNAGMVTLSTTTLSSNAAGSGGVDSTDYGGGGLFCAGSGGIGGNGGRGGDGGGVYNASAGTLTIANATLAGNTAGSGGSGADGASGFGSPCNGNAGDGGDGGNGGNGGGISNNGSLSVSSTTISANTAGGSGAAGAGGNNGGGTGSNGINGDGGISGRGGGIYNEGATASLSASILAGTTSAGSANTPDNCAAATAITDKGYNVEDTGSCGLGAGPASLSGESDTAIGLAPLGPNGGPTNTESLPTSSAAHYLIPVSSGACLATDQTGAARPQSAGEFCDAGAYEAPASQAITFTSAPPTATVGGPSYVVSATGGGSGQPVTFSTDPAAASICSVVASDFVNFDAVGTCVIDANQAGGFSGDTTYPAAPQSQQSFSIGQGSQAIEFTSPAPNAVVGGATYSPAASGGGSDNSVTFTIDPSATSVCSISNGVVSFAAAGICLIDANQAGTANYLAAPQAQQSFTVDKASQTITFTSSPNNAFVAGTYTPTATGGASGNPVTFTIDAGASSVCSISSGLVSFSGVGTCVIDANQTGDADHLAAPQAQQSFTVDRASQTITFTSAAPSAVFGGPTYTPEADGGGSSNSVTLTIDAASSSVCSISGGLVSFVGAGICTVDANQDGNANYLAAPQAQQSFTVGKASQAITFTSPAPSEVFGGPTYTPTASGGGSGNPVTLTIDASASSVCSMSGGVVSFVGVGTCAIDANEAGDANHLAAPQARQDFTVIAAATAVRLTPSATSVPYGHEQVVNFGVLVRPQFTGNPSGTVKIVSGATTLCSLVLSSGLGSCSVAVSSPTLLAAGTYAVTAAYSGSAFFATSTSGPATFTVSKAPTKTSLTLSAKTVVHGHEQTLKFTTTLRPAFAGVPTGAVAVFAGKIKLCSVNITAASHGTGTCSPVATALPPGSYSVIADYGGASNFAPSASGVVALKVT
jgi:hypothetical protein